MDSKMRENEITTVAGAVDILEKLGFREYEARCLVALVTRPEATAAEVSEIADVPRSRVYDVADSLADRNLVEVCAGEPRRFRAHAVETIIETITEQCCGHVDTLEETLAHLESDDDSDSSECTVWQLSGYTSIRDRLCTLISGAEDEVVMLLTGEFITEEYVEELHEMSKSGLKLTLMIDAPKLQSWIRGECPDARVVDVPDIWSQISGKNQVVHLVLADWRAVLVVTATYDTPASDPEFQGTLSEGESCGFVLTLGQTLREQLGE